MRTLKVISPILVLRVEIWVLIAPIPSHCLLFTFSDFINVDLGRERAVFLLLITRYFVVSVRGSFLFLRVLRIGCIILLGTSWTFRITIQLCLTHAYIENTSLTYIASKRNSNKKHHTTGKYIYKSSAFRELIRENIY